MEPVGPAKGVSVEVFSEQVKLLMWDQFGFENYHNTFEEKILFQQKECDFKAERINKNRLLFSKLAVFEGIIFYSFRN